MITTSDVYRYLQCPHWPYWERFGDLNERRALTEFEEQRLADGLDHEEQVVQKTYDAFITVEEENVEDGFAKTMELMRQGVPAIYQGCLMHEDKVGRPDILERQEGESVFGSWHYVPVDVKRVHEMKKEHAFSLIFSCVLLEKIQQRFPAHPALLNSDDERLLVEPDKFLAEFWELMTKLARVVDGECPEPVYRKSCEDTSPWGRACFRLAKTHDDIALIFNVDMKRLVFLREHGVRTIYDAADMDPAAFAGLEPGATLKSLQAIQRQARSLIDQSVMIKKAWVHQPKGLKIYFDIESHPMTDTDYLYGFLIEGSYRSFLAERPEDEEKMWRAFLAWLPTLPEEYTVYHYADYEAKRIWILAKRYGDMDHPSLKHFHARFVDLKEAAREHAVFPLYFYSLKNICKFLGFLWTSQVQSGGASIGAYEAWLATQDRTILDDLVHYNEDDVRATAFLCDWLDLRAREESIYLKPYPWHVE